MSGVLVVTGAARGIGAAVACLAAARRFAVCINYRTRREKAEEVVDSVRQNGGRAIALQADVAQESDVLKLFEAVDRQLGPPTALVNNAGVTGGRARLEDMTSTQLLDTLAVNVVGSFLCAREAVRRMSTRRQGRGGAIVNISSGAARTGSPGTYVHYAASKGAIDTMTLGLAREVAAEGIRVNAVRAGYTDTDIHEFARHPDKYAQLAALPPIKRLASPAEIAQVVVWLLSDEAAYVTGALVDATGGL